MAQVTEQIYAQIDARAKAQAKLRADEESRSRAEAKATVRALPRVSAQLAASLIGKSAAEVYAALGPPDRREDNVFGSAGVLIYRSRLLGKQLSIVLEEPSVAISGGVTCRDRVGLCVVSAAWH